MKKLILTTLVLLLLTSCSQNQDNNDDFIYIRGYVTSVYENIIISRSPSGAITYTDLETMVTIPACVQSNCSHDRNSVICTAMAENPIMCSVIYGENLYIFTVSEQYELVLYKCDLSGGNRRQVFSYKENHPLASNPTIIPRFYDDSCIYFDVHVNILHERDNGHLVSGKLSKSLIFRYNFATDKSELLIETEINMTEAVHCFGGGNGTVFYIHNYNENKEYDELSEEEFEKIVMDFNSDYWETQRRDSVIMNIESGEKMVVSDDFLLKYWRYHNGLIYYIEEDKLISYEPFSKEYAIVHSDVPKNSNIHFHFDDTPFLTLYDEENEILLFYYYKDNKWNEGIKDIAIQYESRDYFLFIYDSNEEYIIYAILKSDYYAGIDTSFEISPPE